MVKKDNFFFSHYTRRNQKLRYTNGEKVSIIWQKNQTFLSLLLLEDFKTKSIHLGKQISVEDIQTRSYESIMEELQEYYKKITPKYPEKWNPKSTNLKVEVFMNDQRRKISSSCNLWNKNTLMETLEHRFHRFGGRLFWYGNYAR